MPTAIAPATTAVRCSDCRHRIADRLSDGAVRLVGKRGLPIVLDAGRLRMVCGHEVYDGSGPTEHPDWRTCGAENVVTA